MGRFAAGLLLIVHLLAETLHGGQALAHAAVALQALEVDFDLVAQALEALAFAGQFGAFARHFHLHFARRFVQLFVASADLLNLGV